MSGRTLGIIIFFLSTSGVIFSGWLIDTFKKKGFQDGYFKVALMICIVTIPISYFVMNDESLEKPSGGYTHLLFVASMPLAISATVYKLLRLIN